MPVPTAQELNQRIAFKNTTTPIDQTGGATQSTTAANAWARIRTAGMGSIETTDQQHQISIQPYEIWVRYNSAITAFLEIEWGSRTLVMTAPPQEILDESNRRWMVIQAEETTEHEVT